MSVYIAKESFAAEIDGVPVVVRKGVTRVRAGHPLLAGREQMFEPADAHADFDVEAATAAPGERRARPRKTAADE